MRAEQGNQLLHSAVESTGLFDVKQIFNWNLLNESDLKYWSKYLHSLSSTKAKIFELTSYSSKLETVLLALLKDQQDMLDKFEAFQSVYERDKGEVKLNSFRSIKKLFPTHIILPKNFDWGHAIPSWVDFEPNCSTLPT